MIRWGWSLQTHILKLQNGVVDISGINYNPITVKLTKCSGKPYDVATAKKHTAESIYGQNGALRGSEVPWQMERAFHRFFEPNHYHIIGHTWGTFDEGYTYHCSWNVPTYQNTKDWESCRLRWNPTWGFEKLESRRSWLIRVLCNKYRGISLLKRFQRNIWTKAGGYQCSLRLGSSSADHIFTLQQIFKKSL